MDRLRSFFEQFRSLNIGSNDQLTKLVEQAQRLTEGVSVAELKVSKPDAKVLGDNLAAIKANVGNLFELRPRRHLSFEDGAR